VKLYLQSLPSPPYRILIFAAILAALVVALPLQVFGNVFYVLGAPTVRRWLQRTLGAILIGLAARLAVTDR